MSERSVLLLLEDILEALEKVDRYTQGYSISSFLKDQKTRDAVIRNLEIIGEAANRFPESFRARNPGIPWKRIIGLRHRIEHEYFGVDPMLIWHILKMDLPEFYANLKDLYKGFCNNHLE